MYQVKHTITGSEPLTLTEVKNFLKISYTLDDAFITELITSARALTEKLCGLSLVVDSIEYYTTDFEDSYLLPFPEHDAIVEVKIGGVVTTDYIKTGLVQFEIEPNITQTYDTFSFYAKYTTKGTLPQGLKDVLLKIVADMYENRNAQAISQMAMALLLPFKKYC